MNTSGAAPGLLQPTELEQRVLAHARILQSLIAYMCKTEPRFMDHLRGRFVEPMKMARHEHDYRDVDDYAEEFIRAIMLIGEAAKPLVTHDVTYDALTSSPVEMPKQKPLRGKLPLVDRVRMQETSGIWRITVDGAFWGDFQRKEQACAAMALAKLSLSELKESEFSD